MSHRGGRNERKRSGHKSRHNEATERTSNEESTRNSDQSGEMDRLSDLPEPIIHQILQRLPLADAISTRSLSRLWRRSIWPSCPFLYFDECTLGANFFRFRKEYEENRSKLALFVLQSLKEQKKYCSTTVYKLAKFDFLMAASASTTYRVLFKDREQRTIDGWLKFTLENNVEELDLRIKCISFPLFHRFIDSVFASELLTTLSLECCKIKSWLSVNLPSLKNLRLSEVEISGQGFRNFIRGCPSLEHLCVWNCSSLKNIKVSVPNLKTVKLEVYRYNRTQIESPSLRYVELTCIRYRRVWMISFSNLNFLPSEVKIILEDPKDTGPVDWQDRLKRLLNWMPKSKLLTLVCPSDQALVFLGKSRDKLLPDLKHLKLEISNKSTSCSAIVKGLTRSFPGLETVTIKSGSINELIKL